MLYNKKNNKTIVIQKVLSNKNLKKIENTIVWVKYSERVVIKK